MDGANLNAILGRFKPGEAGFDVMHINTHKTFSTPHGGGGPGAGPVGVGEKLAAVPARAARPARGRRHVPARAPGRAADLDRAAAQLRRQHRRARARVRLHLRATAARASRGHRRRGPRGELPASSASARRTTSRTTAPCKHEFVASASAIKKKTGVRTLDIAKRLIDHGFHPPTIYFPLIVDEGMLIEPTETESLETLDAFADALIAIAAEAETDPETVKDGAAHGAGPAPRRGDRRAPAEPALAGHDRPRTLLALTDGCRAGRRWPRWPMRSALTHLGCARLRCSPARLASLAQPRRTQSELVLEGNARSGIVMVTYQTGIEPFLVAPGIV